MVRSRRRLTAYFAVNRGKPMGTGCPPAIDGFADGGNRRRDSSPHTELTLTGVLARCRLPEPRCTTAAGTFQLKGA